MKFLAMGIFFRNHRKCFVLLLTEVNCMENIDLVVIFQVVWSVDCIGWERNNFRCWSINARNHHFVYRFRLYQWQQHVLWWYDSVWRRLPLVKKILCACWWYDSVWIFAIGKEENNLQNGGIRAYLKTPQLKVNRSFECLVITLLSDCKCLLRENIFIKSLKNCRITMSDEDMDIIDKSGFKILLATDCHLGYEEHVSDKCMYFNLIT